MPIISTRDGRATRFESSASNNTETKYFKGLVRKYLRIVGISRGTSCILFT